MHHAAAAAAELWRCLPEHVMLVAAHSQALVS